MNYEEMTNAELKQYCEDNGIEVTAKNPAKPNKAELLGAIDGTMADANAQDDSFAAEAVQQVEEAKKAVEKPKIVATGEKTAAQKRRAVYNKKMALKRVLVTDNKDNQTKQDLMTVAWGNRELKYHTDRVVLGKPWHVRQGALDNIIASTYSKPVQNYETNTIDYVTTPMFNIVDLGILSKEEYARIAEKQNVRNATLVE